MHARFKLSHFAKKNCKINLNEDMVLPKLHNHDAINKTLCLGLSHSRLGLVRLLS